MARKMESKGARLLAILLALIMIGSILTYAARRSQTTHQREVEFSFPEGFQGWISKIPAGADQVVYVNFANSNPEMSEVLKKVIMNNMNTAFFTDLRLSQGVHKFMVMSYPGMFPEILYLIDVNKTKVFFTYKSEDVYDGFKIKSNKGISLVDQTSPFLFGTTGIVAKTLDTITGKRPSLVSEIGNFTDKMPASDYNLVIMFRGDTVKQIVHGNTSGFFDFYLAAYRINTTPNGTFYEKVVLMNFTKSGWFVKSNKTAYYQFKNFKGGLSMAVMGDTNLTKLMQLEPEMRMIEIKPVENTGNTGNATNTSVK